MPKTLKRIRPLKVKEMTFDQLPKPYQQAVEKALERVDGNAPDDAPVRVETYRTKDIIHIFSHEWEWQTTLEDVDAHISSNDVERIEKIMSLIPKKGQWPYVSYWAEDLEELREVTREDNDDISVPNHGDGYHRVIAAHELKLPTVDIVFIVRNN